MNDLSHPVSSSAYDPIFRRLQQRFSGRIKVPFSVRLWGNRVYQFGDGESALDIVVHNPKGLAALRRLDEMSICEAYMAGSLDVVGDMFGFISLRRSLSDYHPLVSLWRRIAPWLIGRSGVNRKAIAAHYEFSNDFYLSFLDSTRSYSQGIFSGDDEALAIAQCRKLDFAIESCGLKAGDRVLDVGCGWGCFTEYAGRRGINVTSLTISHQSEAFVSSLIQQYRLPAHVVYEDFMTHISAKPYDAIVVLGVMEHLPDYPAVLRQFLRLLKPGGRIYLDASAFKEKYVKPAFISRYIFPGDHSFFCLHDFLTAVSKTPFEVLSIYNDRHNYYLTCKAWAEHLDAARHEIVHDWGEALYRRFRLYLWGATYAFNTHGMEAYRLLLELPRSV